MGIWEEIKKESCRVGIRSCWRVGMWDGLQISGAVCVLHVTGHGEQGNRETLPLAYGWGVHAR